MVRFANCVSSLSIGKKHLKPTEKAIVEALQRKSVNIKGLQHQYVGATTGHNAAKTLENNKKNILYCIEEDAKANSRLTLSHIIANYCPNLK